MFILVLLLCSTITSFASSLQEQAALTVRAALASGLIQDSEIRGILEEIRDSVLPREDLIIAADDEPGCIEREYLARVPPVLPIHVHACPSLYQESSPQTLIHEAVHVVQVGRVLAAVGRPGECQADLAAMEATAAAVKTGAAPASWNVPGFYFSHRLCQKSLNKYRFFLTTINSPVALARHVPIATEL